MNIYFLNKNSKIKGPYDITDAGRKKLMKMGDLCIRESGQSIFIWLLVSELNTWKACKCLGSASGDLGLKGNTLLYSFDGISQRRGNVLVMEHLCGLFKDHALEKLFRNAVDILTYRCDYWDITHYYTLLFVQGKDVQTVSKLLGDDQPKASGCAYLFENYLGAQSVDLFQELHRQGLPVKEIYTQIRKKYPQEFRKSMHQFLIEHPHSTVYDKVRR